MMTRRPCPTRRNGKDRRRCATTTTTTTTATVLLLFVLTIELPTLPLFAGGVAAAAAVVIIPPHHEQHAATTVAAAADNGEALLLDDNDDDDGDEPELPIDSSSSARAVGGGGSQPQEAIKPAPPLPAEPHAGAYYKGLSAYPTRDVPRKEGEHCTPSSLWRKEVDMAKYEFGCEEIEDMLESDPKLVGFGGFRHVYLAEYKNRTVAVKRLKEGKYFLRFHRIETATLDAVRGHPNIVQMLGVCNTTLVTEAFGTDIQHAVTKRTTALPLRDAIAISLDVANAVQALHKTAAIAPIVHFDVKPAQMLMTADGRVKLNDFNTAWFMSTGPDGTPCPFTLKGKPHLGPWRSPEYLSMKPLTEKVDIYRMGLVFKKYLTGGGVHVVGTNGQDPIIPAFERVWHKIYKGIVEDMVCEEPEWRPSTTEVIRRLEAILQEMPVSQRDLP